MCTLNTTCSLIQSDFVCRKMSAFFYENVIAFGIGILKFTKIRFCVERNGSHFTYEYYEIILFKNLYRISTYPDINGSNFNYTRTRTIYNIDLIRQFGEFIPSRYTKISTISQLHLNFRESYRSIVNNRNFITTVDINTERVTFKSIFQMCANVYKRPHRTHQTSTP